MLDADQEFLTSTMNFMELRSVLTKKRRLEQLRAHAIQDEITTDVRIVIPSGSDIMTANRLQNDTLLYPIDCLILACARNQDAELVSFDAELQEAGAIDPTTVVRE
nr:PIN domain-containing protein [Natranaeroarchaeum aerophilus]